MLTKEQLKLFGIFRKDIFAKLTFNQIKTAGGQKSNNTVQLALKEFKKQNIVRAQKTGDVTAYSLNLDSNLALSYLNLINSVEFEINKTLPKEVLDRLQKRIFKCTEFFIILIFGSYAKESATAKSDLDIAIIVDSEQTKKEVAPFIETVKRREIIHIDYHIFTRKEFLEMLAIELENVGKEIYRKNIIVYGTMEYYNMIRGGIK